MGGYGNDSNELDPELVRAILEMQMQQPKQNKMQRQLKMADSMRSDAKGQLAGRQAGGAYIAPNIANVAANLYGNYKAGQTDAGVGAQETAMGQQNSGLMQRYFDALRQRQGGGMGGMGGGMTMDGGGGMGDY